MACRGPIGAAPAVGALLLLILSVFGGVAAAQGAACESRVSDPAGHLSTEEVDLLADLIAELGAGGVRARVHLLDDTPTGIDDWFAAAEASCDGWRDGAERAADLLVLAVSLGDRETGTWFGDELAPGLEGQYLSVHDRMAGQLRMGDLGGALATGLAAYADLVGITISSTVPGPATQPQPVAPQPAPDQAAPVRPVAAQGQAADQPAGQSADQPAPRGWPVLLGLLGLAGASALAVVGVRRARERRWVQKSAAAVRAGVRERYVTLDGRWGDLIDLVALARGRLAEDDRHAVTIEHEREQAADAMQALTAAYVETERAHDTEARTGTKDLRDAKRAWTDVQAVVDTTETELSHVEAAVADVDRAEERCEGLLADHDQRLAAARTAVDAAAAAGFKVEHLQDAIDRAVADHDAGVAAHTARRLGDAEEDLGRADDTLHQVTVAADGLADRRRDLVAHHADLQQRRTAAAIAVAAISATAKGLRDGYARAVWDPIEQAPDDAAGAMVDISQALDAAADAATMQVQRFDDADAALASAAAGLDAVDTIVAGVRTVEENLRSAEVEYADARREATSDLDEALRFAEQHADDVDAAHLPALERARSVLADAVRIAGDVRPDPLAALHRLREVETTADAVLRACRTEKQQRDAARSRARSRITDARRSIDQARSRSGMGLFGWSARVKDELDSATSLLHTADQVLQDRPEEAQRIASAAERTALNILEEARRRADSAGASGGSFSGRSSSGGRSSGGSSRSSGGGGSSSFRGGGGGSSRW